MVYFCPYRGSSLGFDSRHRCEIRSPRSPTGSTPNRCYNFLPSHFYWLFFIGFFYCYFAIAWRGGRGAVSISEYEAVRSISVVVLTEVLPGFIGGIRQFLLPHWAVVVSGRLLVLSAGFPFLPGLRLCLFFSTAVLTRCRRQV